MIDINIIQDNIKFILSTRYWIIYLVAFILIYNFKSFDNKINFLILGAVFLYFLTDHYDQFKYSFDNSQLTTEGNIFFKELIGDKEINPELTTILYNAKKLYPYDHLNYTKSLEWAHDVSEYMIYLKNCVSPMDVQDTVQLLTTSANNLLNHFNSISYSLPVDDVEHIKYTKELQKLLYTYIQKYADNPKKIDPWDKDSSVSNKAFMFYRL